MAEVDTNREVFVARQAIFRRNRDVLAYELLFRSGLENCYRNGDGDGDESTLDVISNGLLEIGLEDMSGGKPVFINFTRKLLVEGTAQLLPPRVVTVEILEDIVPDAPVLEACRRLKGAGFVLAMDDFVLDALHSPLLDLADIVKVDFLLNTPAQRATIARHLIDRGIKPLAEKVETDDDFQQALASAYEFFQGYFFSKPVVCTGRALSPNRLLSLQMLEEISRPDLDLDGLERIIRMDLPLTYRLLRFINSAWFGLRTQIDSVRHALVWLGPLEVRKCFSMISLRNLGTDKTNELFSCAIARARSAESLAPALGMRSRSGDLFLLGMFSLIDAILDQPMEAALAKLPLPSEVAGALQGSKNALRTVLDTIVAYEQGDWQAFSRGALALGVPEHEVARAHNESRRWADAALVAMSA